MHVLSLTLVFALTQITYMHALTLTVDLTLTRSTYMYVLTLTLAFALARMHVPTLTLPFTTEIYMLHGYKATDFLFHCIPL